MFCPKCGTNNNNENVICSKCGYSFDNIPQNIKDEAAAKSAEYTENIKTDTSADAIHGEVYNSSPRPAGKGRIKDYFVQSILVAIFCSVAFGAAAIIFSGLTSTERTVGNLAKAEIYSEKTKLFCIIALALGIVKYLFVAIVVIMAAFGISVPFLY